MIKLQKIVTKFRRRLFFCREHFVFGSKLKNMRLNSSEDFSFFLEITMILGQNLFLVYESQTIFCSIRNVLENNDLGKRHKIWEKLHCPPYFFGWYAYATN